MRVTDSSDEAGIAVTYGLNMGKLVALQLKNAEKYKLDPRFRNSLNVKEMNLVKLREAMCAALAEAWKLRIGKPSYAASYYGQILSGCGPV